MIPQDTLRELTQLRDRVAYLEAELELMRHREITHAEALMVALGTTLRQARTIYAMTQGVLTREQAYGLDLHRVEDCDPRALDTLIKHVRRRLPWLKITTIYGVGYTIDDQDSLKRVRACLRGETHQ